MAQDPERITILAREFSAAALEFHEPPRRAVGLQAEPEGTEHGPRRGAS